MVPCKELETESLQVGHCISLTPTPRHMANLGHVSKLWISYLHQEDTEEMIFTMLLMSNIWNSVTEY